MFTQWPGFFYTLKRQQGDKNRTRDMLKSFGYVGHADV